MFGYGYHEFTDTLLRNLKDKFSSVNFIGIRVLPGRDAHRFINNVGKVCYNEEKNILFCSKIFKWYRQDFLKVAPSIPEYIRPYLDSDLQISASTPIEYLYYDWNINQRISS